MLRLGSLQLPGIAACDPGRCKPGTQLVCADRDDMEANLSGVFQDAFSMRTTHAFQTGRWTKSMPILRKMGGAMLLNDCFLTSLLSVKAPDQENFTKMRQRFEKMAKRVRGPKFKFHIALTLATASFSDEIMQQHFWESSHTGSKVKDKQCGAGGSHQDKTRTWRIQFRVHSVLHRLWKSFKDCDGVFGHQHSVSELEIAWLFFLAGEDVSQRLLEIQTDVYATMSEIHLRFLRESSQFPKRCAKAEGGTDAAWQDEVGALVGMRDCDLRDLPLCWKRQLEKLPAAERVQSLKDRFYFYDATTINDTRQEEDQHRDQRVFAGGFQNKPASFATQSVLVSNHSLSKEWHGLGGRDLTLPPPDLRRLYQDTCQHRTIYARPNSGGSVPFFT